MDTYIRHKQRVTDFIKDQHEENAHWKSVGLQNHQLDELIIRPLAHRLFLFDAYT